MDTSRPTDAGRKTDATQTKDATAPSDGTTADDAQDAAVDASGVHTLTVSPASAAITITGQTVPATRTFTASLDGTAVTGPVTWTLDTNAEGTISATGSFTTTALVGGPVTVTATYGAYRATAALNVYVKFSQTVLAGSMDPGPSAANATALAGTPLPDPGATATPPNATQILYPYDKTVMPTGIASPVLQFSPGSLPPVDAVVSLVSPYFNWQGFFHVQNTTAPQFSIPEAIWDGALLSSPAQSLAVSVTKAAGGIAYGPATESILVAPGSLPGAIFYTTYDTPGNGLYSLVPKTQGPAVLRVPGCLVCHAVSANGTMIALGTDDPTLAAQSGVYAVSADESLTQITEAPTGLGGDSRGLSYATFTPDGQYVLRSTDNFWGGTNQLAWKVDPVAGTLTPATVVGLGASVSADVPTISPDGLHYAFTTGAGDTSGTAGRSINLMDLVEDTTTDTLTFSGRRLLIDNGPTGSVAKFVTFLPNPNELVLEEGENFCTSYDQMLPTWDVTCSDYSFTGSTGRLYQLDASGQTAAQIELATMNAGNAAIDRQRNYEPFALPVTAGGFYWVVFTSIREYGNTLTGANVQKQLWIGAISINAPPGTDASHPPFFVPNQSSTRNERGTWALQPCEAAGATCETGVECCDGFCRANVPGGQGDGGIASDAGSGTTARTCQTTGGACSQLSEKCAVDTDCCDNSMGATCIGGFCTPKSAF